MPEFQPAPTPENPDGYGYIGCTPAELADIKVDTIIKVCHTGERFWAIVTKVDGNNITAIVDNSLVFVKEFNCGDSIHVQKFNVFAIYTDDPQEQQEQPEQRRKLQAMMRWILKERANEKDAEQRKGFRSSRRLRNRRR